MDNLTHSLVGALIGQAGLKRRTGLAMPALIIGANIPDIDAGCVVFGMESLAMRRGLTHGPLAMILLPLVLAGALWWFDRWQEGRGKRLEGRLPVHFGWLYALSFVACLSHPALDWLNNYGVRLLEPLSDRWFYGDALFIIDLWLWLGLGFATWRSLRLEGQGRYFEGTAQVALGAALLYSGLNVAVSELDRTMNSDFAKLIPNPVPVAFWERQRIGGDGDGRWWIEGRQVGDVPLSQCDLAAASGRNSDVDAFLFWSRAPYVERLSDGRWMLRDARFASQAGDRFSVPLPATACDPG